MSSYFDKETKRPIHEVIDTHVWMCWRQDHDSTHCCLYKIGPMLPSPDPPYSPPGVRSFGYDYNLLNAPLFDSILDL